MSQLAYVGHVKVASEGNAIVLSYRDGARTRAAPTARAVRLARTAASVTQTRGALRHFSPLGTPTCRVPSVLR